MLVTFVLNDDVIEHEVLPGDEERLVLDDSSASCDVIMDQGDQLVNLACWVLSAEMEIQKQSKCVKKAAVELAQSLKSSTMVLKKQGLFLSNSR